MIAASSEPEIGRVEAVYVYPIKSCRGIRLESPHPFNKLGLRHDREWCITQVESGSVMTLREWPQMAKIVPKLVEGVHPGVFSRLVLSCADSEDTVTVPLAPVERHSPLPEQSPRRGRSVVGHEYDEETEPSTSVSSPKYFS